MCYSFCFFFFNDTATTEIYTLSLHDALPISPERRVVRQSHVLEHTDRHEGVVMAGDVAIVVLHVLHARAEALDRKSTRLNSSHSQISYAVFCLKKKNI